MVSPFARIVMAPLRSLAFTIFGGIVLAQASVTVGALSNEAIAGIFTFGVLVALGFIAAWASWRERYGNRDDEALVEYAVRASLVLIAVVCGLAAFAANGGIFAAGVFAALTWSLSRVRPDESGFDSLNTAAARHSSAAR